MFEETVCNVFPINPDYFIWLTYTSETGQVWRVVSNVMRTEYYLFKGDRQTRYKSDNPCELYKYIKE